MRRFILAGGLAAFVAAGAAYAVSFSWDFDKTISGGYVELPAGETFDGNVGVFGGHCEVNGDINGDLTVCGGDVRVNGNVTGDVFAAGGNVIVAGNCAGETGAFGGSVSLPGAFAGPTEVGGGSVWLSGNFDGPVDSSGGAVFLDGSFAGPVEAEGEKVFVGAGADLGAGLSYLGELVRDPSARISGPITIIEPEEVEPEPEEEPSFAGKVITWLLWRVGEFLALMLFAFLVWVVRPGWLTALPAKMRDKPWQSPLAGLVFLVVMEVLIVGLLITIIGIPSAFAVIVLSLVFLYASWVFFGTWLGNIVLKPIFKGKDYPALFATATGALVLVVVANLLWFIPYYVGFVLYLLLCFVVIWYGFGAGFLYWWSVRKAPAA